MITWPSVLPNPSVSYSHSHNPSVIRTEFESGKIRQRNRFNKTKYQASVQWQFTDAEYHLFKSLLASTLNNGNDSFYINLASGDGLKQHKATIVNGQYEANYQNWFGWVVSCQMDLEDVAYMSDDSMALLLSLPYGDLSTIDDLNNYASELEPIVNNNWNFGG